MLYLECARTARFRFARISSAATGDGEIDDIVWREFAADERERRVRIDRAAAVSQAQNGIVA